MAGEDVAGIGMSDEDDDAVHRVLIQVFSSWCSTRGARRSAVAPHFV